MPWKNLPRSNQTAERHRSSKVQGTDSLDRDVIQPNQTRATGEEARPSAQLEAAASSVSLNPEKAMISLWFSDCCFVDFVTKYQLQAGLGRGQEWEFQPLVTRSSTPSSVSSPSQGCDTQRVSLHLPPPEPWRAGAGQSLCAWVGGATACWCSWQHYTDKLRSKCSLLRWTHCVRQYSSHSLKYNKE